MTILLEPPASSGSRVPRGAVARVTDCPRMLGVLHCTQEADHDYGCTFQSTSGVPDRHSLTSGE
jgi:hypothetical protein